MAGLKVNNNTSIVKDSNGFYYSVVAVPMYPPFKDYLFTKDLETARRKALENYNNYIGL